MAEPLQVRGRWERRPASPLGRAVDRPVFWWSAGAVFLANASLSAAEGRWVLAVLHVLTCLWAVVAGVTARVPAAGPPTLDGVAGGTTAPGP
ncbi:hypothetical protein JOD57_004901 [Geodermatophilus bullaregiensis]|uniref:hypothetical protein n=1 Tax=Geodermatophilus bullaregiensis TaxID=1564160 RepID=UPI0019569C34|nr:hypothetical protein [Geodermatophilus bullaregiensis]MBM7809064.1 hypothetical protein [Geodermatophilus bullaregiensis]